MYIPKRCVLIEIQPLLMWAADSGQYKMARFLPARGAEKGLKDNRGFTAQAIHAMQTDCHIGLAGVIW